MATPGKFKPAVSDERAKIVRATTDGVYSRPLPSSPAGRANPQQNNPQQNNPQQNKQPTKPYQPPTDQPPQPNVTPAKTTASPASSTATAAVGASVTTGASVTPTSPTGLVSGAARVNFGRKFESPDPKEVQAQLQEAEAEFASSPPTSGTPSSVTAAASATPTTWAVPSRRIANARVPTPNGAPFPTGFSRDSRRPPILRSATEAPDAKKGGLADGLLLPSPFAEMPNTHDSLYSLISPRGPVSVERPEPIAFDKESTSKKLSNETTPTMTIGSRANLTQASALRNSSEDALRDRDRSSSNESSTESTSSGASSEDSVDNIPERKKLLNVGLRWLLYPSIRAASKRKKIIYLKYQTFNNEEIRYLFQNYRSNQLMISLVLRTYRPDELESSVTIKFYPKLGDISAEVKDVRGLEVGNIEDALELEKPELTVRDIHSGLKIAADYLSQTLKKRFYATYPDHSNIMQLVHFRQQRRTAHVSTMVFPPKQERIQLSVNLAEKIPIVLELLDTLNSYTSDPNRARFLRFLSPSRYVAFLTLCNRYPNKQLVPPPDVRLLWSMHMWKPVQYIAFCQAHFATVIDNPSEKVTLSTDETSELWDLELPGSYEWRAKDDPPPFLPFEQQQLQKALEGLSLSLDYVFGLGELYERCNSLEDSLYSKGEIQMDIEEYCRVFMLHKTMDKLTEDIQLQPLNIQLVWFAHTLYPSKIAQDFGKVAKLPRVIEDYSQLLPEHLKLAVLNYLDDKDLVSLATCNRLYHKLVCKDELWRRKFFALDNVDRPENFLADQFMDVSWRFLYFQKKDRISQELPFWTLEPSATNLETSCSVQ